MGEASPHLLFAREGAKIAAVDLDEARALPVVEAIRAAGGMAFAIGVDISKTPDSRRIVDRAVADRLAEHPVQHRGLTAMSGILVQPFAK